MINKTVYRDAAKRFQSDLHTLATEESRLKEQLETIREQKTKMADALAGLNNFLGEEESEGLSDAVREIFSETSPDQWLPPISVRKRLERRGFPINEYTQPLAVIHTTLKRLVKQGELETKGIEGKPRYHLIEK